MSWEIERRFLVRVPDAAWDDFGPGRALRQGYVIAGPRTVRIRTGEARGNVLTYKEGTGIRRREVEEIVGGEMADALFTVAAERVIEKVRHRVGPWDLDRFSGALAGLELAEIELEHADAELPEWPSGVDILREVTHDNRFTSSTLAMMPNKEREQWVTQVYAEVGA